MSGNTSHEKNIPLYYVIVQYFKNLFKHKNKFCFKYCAIKYKTPSTS